MSIALANRIKKLEKQLKELYERMAELEKERMLEKPVPPMRRPPRVAPPGENHG